jgi:Raf kinase inhibitor-like YbhB/YbcL family protein
MMSRICSKALLAGLASTLCLAAGPSFSASAEAGPAGDFKLTSTAFQPGATIPKQHTCEGQDISPPLAWSGAPAGTKSFTLIMDDPDAPGRTWVHWVLFDLPEDARSLPENLPKTNELANGARQGRNDFPRIGYGGPCPPPGPAHRYFFKLYALDAKLHLSPGTSKAELEKVMKGHILREARLVGRYKR